MKKLITLIILLFTIQVQAATYYIDTSADAGGDGTTTATSSGDNSHAWNELSDITGLSAGDFVLLNKGDEWRELLTVPTSGSAGSPITFGAYGTGDDPIINGSDIVETWSVVGATTVYSADCDWETNQVFEDNARLTYVTWDTNEATTAADMVTEGAGSWSLDTTGDKVYVLATDELDPDTHTNPGIEVSKRDKSIFISDKSYITIDSISITKAGQWTDNGWGIFIRSYNNNGGSHYITVRNCDVSYCYATGIHSAGDNDINTNITVQDCTVSYNGGSGILIGTNTQGSIIQRNTAHHNGFLADGWGAIRAVGTNIDNVKIFENIVYGNALNGIHIDNGPANVTIWHNESYDNLNGIEVEGTTASTDNVEIYYNLVYGNSGVGISILRETSGNKVYNNAVYGSGLVGIQVAGKTAGVAGSVTNNIIKNNVCSGNWKEFSAIYGGENDGINGWGNVYEYNCFGVESTNFIEWGVGVNKSTYDAWEAAYGFSTQSAEADPIFVDAANDNFHLQGNSPALGLGRYPDEFPLGRSRYHRFALTGKGRLKGRR